MISNENIKNKKNTVLLTGGTGAFGSYLIQYLHSHNDVQLILLVRADSDQEARDRLSTQIDLPKDVEVYKADLSHDYLGLDKNKYQDLTKRVTHVLHAAACTRFNLNIEDIRSFNVQTTKEMIEFASECLKLKRFIYVSSASVAGRRVGKILETDLEHNAGFNNTYEQSKYESELLLREYEKNVPIVVLRPPLIFSKPPDGHRGPVNSLSHGLRLAKNGYLPIFPGTSDSIFDIVEGNETARIIIELLLKNELKYSTYHITNGQNVLTVGGILKILEDRWEKKIPVKILQRCKNI